MLRKQICRRRLVGGKLLFEDLPDYRFSLYVTNLDLPLDQTWNIYNSRADCENRIWELKQNCGLEESFRFIMVAYNLMSLFRHIGLDSNNQATLSTLRSNCFAIGGWGSQHARKRVLKLSLPRQKHPWKDAILLKIQSLAAPFAYFTA